MPKDDSLKLKQRDFKTLKRIESAKKASGLLFLFFEKGFKSFEALEAIVLNYYPEIPVSRLWDFWHFRNMDIDISNSLEDVLEKLKAE